MELLEFSLDLNTKIKCSKLKQYSPYTLIGIGAIIRLVIYNSSAKSGIMINHSYIFFFTKEEFI